MSKPLKPHTKMGVRIRTHEKFRAIARAKRWTIAEAADAVADSFIRRERIKISAISGIGRRVEASRAA